MHGILRAALLAATAAAMAVAPTSASAATNLGSTFAPGICGQDTTYIQTAAPGNTYTVPFNGVITRWSYQAGATNVPTSMKLKIGRVAPGTDLSMNATVTIVGESTAQTPTASAVNTYPTQISVQAGDHIGEYLNGGTFVGCSRSDATYTDHYFVADVAPGSSDTFTVENLQQDISAVLEPDCDHDGLGDETQDPNTSSCNPPAAPTGQRAAALRRCKKRAHKRDWSHKRLKKCKGKAKLLPV
jgi:hypothetical protein